MPHKKFGLDRCSRFNVYWIQTNNQKKTDTQTDKPNLYIDSYTGNILYLIVDRRYSLYNSDSGDILYIIVDMRYSLYNSDTGVIFYIIEIQEIFFI